MAGLGQGSARVRPLITGSQTWTNHSVISIIRLLILVRVVEGWREREGGGGREEERVREGYGGLGSYPPVPQFVTLVPPPHIHR